MTTEPTIDWDRLRNRPLTREEKRRVRDFYSDGSQGDGRDVDPQAEPLVLPAPSARK